MNLYSSLLILFFCVFFSFEGNSQQVIWVHQPFSEKNIPNWRYSKDTVVFSSNSIILGLVNLPNATENPSITIQTNSGPNNQNTATFNLKRLYPNALKWDKIIQKHYQELLQNKNWYYFEITPNPMVVDAYSAVQFLEIIQQAKKTSKNILLTYQAVDSKEKNTCLLSFEQGEGLFIPLWSKLTHYQKMLSSKKEKEEMQKQLIAQCSPHRFTQIEQWFSEKTVLTSELENSDLSIFQAVENIKIITESIPDSVSSYLKRSLRELLMSDISLLEMASGTAKSQKIKQKTDLLKELTLYPELKSFLSLYHQLNGKAGLIKEQEKGYNLEFKKVSDAYQPYKGIHQKYKQLQIELDFIQKQLLNFD